MSSPFRLKRPCKNCPFRTDVPKYLRPERAQEIADSLYEGAEFPCHQTTVDSEDDDGCATRVTTSESAFCAGALITMEKEGFSNQMVRMAERLGMLDVTALDMEAPVYDSLSDWAASYVEIPTVTITNPDGSTEVLEFEHCGVVAENCEDPAGYMNGGGAYSNTEPPTCNPVEDSCHECGNTMCAACTGPSGGLCVYCEESGEQDDDGDDERESVHGLGGPGGDADRDPGAGDLVEEPTALV